MDTIINEHFCSVAYRAPVLGRTDAVFCHVRHATDLLTESKMDTAKKPKCKHLVLDAGPLLSLTPLRGLAESYYTVPQVISELKDKRAREHLERLGLLSGVNVVIKSPDAASLSHGTPLSS